MSKLKLDLNNLMDTIDSTLSAESIETVEENAFGIAMGLELLCNYIKEIAEYGVEKGDEYIINWARNLLIIKEEKP